MLRIYRVSPCTRGDRLAMTKWRNESVVTARSTCTRHLIVSFAFVLLYLFLNLPQVMLVSRLGCTAWYPSIGLAMALMLGVSPCYGLLVCLCDVLSGWLIYHQPFRSWSETLGAIGLAACYAAAAYILRGPLRIDLCLSHRRDIVRYVSVTLAGATASTLIGVACLVGDHTIGWNEFGRSALGWFLGDAVALLGVTPFLLLHVFPWVRSSITPECATYKGQSDFATFKRGANLELLGQTFVLLAMLWYMFGLSSSRFSHLYLCFVPIIWIALRQGIRRVVTGVLVVNFGIILAVYLFPPATIMNTKLGCFMLVISATGLAVGSEVNERERTAIDLRKKSDYLDRLIQNSPLGIIVLDYRGRVELANSAFESLSLYEQDELISVNVDRLLASGARPKPEELDIIPRVFAGEAVRALVPWRRKDGKIIQVKINAVPLILNGFVQGAYEICQDVTESVDARKAREEDAESLNRLVNTLQRRTVEMEFLNDMRDWLECLETEREVGLAVAESMPKLFPECISGAMYLLRSVEEVAEAEICWGEARTLEPMFAPSTCWSLRRGRAHWSEPGTKGIRCSHLPPGNSESLCAPLIAQGCTQGILHLEFPAAHSLSESDAETLRDSRRRLAISVAGHLATSLSSLRLRETLQEQSVRDPLTDLFNRRFLEESLDTELLRAKRNQKPVSILLLDLDHFKILNDAFGHDAGDFVLRAVANAFRGFFRGGDICCRYGGEEFAIILPESSSQNAAVRANALRSEIKRLALHYKGQPLGSITMSGGVVTFPEHGSMSSALLSAADQCLYESKSNGRDRITLPSLHRAAFSEEKASS
jgi:diguanylate cyclase (GGDEF)-like protein/PAS domain S-box-containing protein